ncbi:MAG: flavin reductase family protein [Candidatus Cloacimonetes bacterium]|jgi:flavin reductase (DIM6/NTAB) family NADH-FMN oxidoreductase RutF|nr:flavin reductase family protein [Candidatus Cloacimonadota bacterium]MCB5254397.1 flavin reductase family protein [Candidatus Cloacimonadota bacterium]MCK9243295.1 flavin reductase family protein [Candidatus Cloacimonadota bacterium]MDD3103939.1 flavin reductase family protein [Candidatus Cloacimonadota bacterium]
MMQLHNLPEAYAKVHLPSKVALAVTQKPDGNYNLITIEWFMRTSIAPPMFAISIGHSRYSHDCLQDVRYFNLVFPSRDQKDLLSLAGSQSGRDIDKFSAGKVAFIPGKLHKLPILKDAAAVFECEVVTQVNSGDHTIFVGEVKYSWSNAEGEVFYYE